VSAFILSENWKHIKINGIVGIDKCVAEFDIWEQNYSPYAKFKIKVYENAEGRFTGFSNLQVISPSGYFDGAVGYGKTIEEALTDTIAYFFQLVSWKDKQDWKEEDFTESDPFDF
jgi:hypothetical protein